MTGQGSLQSLGEPCHLMVADEISRLAGALTRAPSLHRQCHIGRRREGLDD